MQTFLPYSNFKKSATVLDNRRLNKQVIEGYQILKAINEETIGWRHHPVTLMWKPYPNALVEYTLTMREEWIHRGKNSSLLEKIQSYFNPDIITVYPPWLGDLNFHLSHRSNLLRKDPEHYGQFNWDIDENWDYYYPVNLPNGEYEITIIPKKK